MNSPATGRRGIALVIVLGLMAMLAILGISFATTMRTEHRAARMGGDNLGAIEMTYYGLAEALYHLDRDAELVQWVAPNWTKYTIHSGNNTFHPDKISSGLNDMLVGYGTWFVPSAIVGGPAGGGARDETNNVRWIRVKTPEGKIIGQFCYMLIDVSGFLDPNGNYSTIPELARSQPRLFGTNVTEMTLTNVFLPELYQGRERYVFDGRIGDPRTKPYGRIETIADMRPALAWKDLWTVPQVMRNVIATNFFPFSYYPPGYADSATREAKPQTDLRGTGPELVARSGEIKAALTGLIPASELDAFFNNLIDYVDDDYVPGGLASTIGSGQNNADSFCTEPVPMLNELQIGCVYQGGGGTYSLRFRVHTELFFPFLFTSNSLSTAPPPPQLQLRFRGRLEGGTFEPKAFNQTVTINWNPNWWVRSGTTAASDPTSPQLTVQAINLTMSAPATNAVPPERLVIEEWSVTLPNGVVVDRLAPAAGGVVASLPMDEYLSVNINSAQPIYCGWECNDPRVNWLLGNAKHWPYSYKARVLSNPFDPDVTTLGKMNRSAQKEQGEWVMYVSNGPLYSIGELGYLLFRSTRPWQTISFFPAAGGGVAILPVLDRFTLFPYPRHGLVNINTRITNVLATAFNNCPVELAPGIRQAGDGSPLRPSEAMEIAGAIVGVRPNPGFINMSDIRNVAALGTAVPRITSWLAREGLIRNTHGLLGIRQNLIVALIAGQSLQEFTDPESRGTSVTRLAGHRAFATIWRDPYKENIGGQLMHRIFVRNFRWYDEWVGTGEDVEPGLP